MDKEIAIGLLGFGTVGTGVARIIQNHQEDLQHKLGVNVVIRKVLVKDLAKQRDVELDPSVYTTDVNEILNDPSIQIIAEVMGGTEEAKQAIELALKAGKQVVTANKDVMAESGSELLMLADEQSCDLLYEASVAGGIPIIRTLEDGFASDRISSLMGIVNGTTNYILTKMKEEGMSYEDALAKATELGYAEADPSADVGNLDAARKLTILSALAYSSNASLDDVYVRGMEEMQDGDMELAGRFGYTIKMLGISKADADGIEMSAEPVFLADSHPLAAVSNEFNAVYIRGEAVGEAMLYGPGAGSLPTATSVVSDIMEAIRSLLLGVSGKRSHHVQYNLRIKPDSSRFSHYFHRILVDDEIGVLTKLTGIYSKHGASLQSVMQHPADGPGKAELLLLTHQISRAQHLAILGEVGEKARVISHYRVEGENK